jgi:gliding motility-associated-like protein
MNKSIFLIITSLFLNFSFSQGFKVQHQTLNLGANKVNKMGNGQTNGEEIGPNNHMPSDDDLEIFNLVTPNGDGDNDVFVIRNIERYPDNSVEIYNRWGVKVFDVNGYGQNQNYFRGISEGRATVNQDAELPVGTYWYIIKYKNDQGVWKQRVGYLYLNK